MSYSLEHVVSGCCPDAALRVLGCAPCFAEMPTAAVPDAALRHSCSLVETWLRLTLRVLVSCVLTIMQLWELVQKKKGLE